MWARWVRRSSPADASKGSPKRSGRATGLRSAPAPQRSDASTEGPRRRTQPYCRRSVPAVTLETRHYLRRVGYDPGFSARSFIRDWPPRRAARVLLLPLEPFRVLLDKPITEQHRVTEPPVAAAALERQAHAVHVRNGDTAAGASWIQEDIPAQLRRNRVRLVELTQVVPSASARHRRLPGRQRLGAVVSPVSDAKRQVNVGVVRDGGRPKAPQIV